MKQIERLTLQLKVRLLLIWMVILLLDVMFFLICYLQIIALMEMFLIQFVETSAFWIFSTFPLLLLLLSLLLQLLLLLVLLLLLQVQE